MEMKNGQASTGGSSGPSKNNLPLKPVLPYSTGEGLPYAPENWPKPGDKWGWRTGKRFKSCGSFIDRYLYLPETYRGARMFKSKIEVERYITKKFSSDAVEGFFASFSWKIPAKPAAVPIGDVPASLPGPLDLQVAVPIDQKPVEFLHEIEVVQVPNFVAPSNGGSRPLKIVSISSDYEAERQKLKAEIDQVLQDLKKSQKEECKLAKTKLTAQRIHVQNLHEQLDNERAALGQQNSSSSNALPEALIGKMDVIEREVKKLRDMEEVGHGFGKTTINILKEHYGLTVED